MKIEPAKVGDVYLDSLPFSQAGTPEMARAWKAHGVAGFVGYLGFMNQTRLAYILDAGLKFSPVTLAGEYEDGPQDEVFQLKSLGVPEGAHVWLDLEGMKAFRSDPVVLAGKVNAWARGVRAAQYRSALYVGVPQPFTSEELWALSVDRYWHGQGSVRDRTGQLAEPFRNFQNCRGWNMIQAAPSKMLGGCLVDFNMIYGDYKGDVPMVVTAA